MSLTTPAPLDDVRLLTDWTRRNRPESLPLAEAAMERVRRELPSVHRKADRFLRFMDYQAEELPPELRPWFWDSVARALLLTGGAKCLWAAPRAHARARKAEAEHGLAVDVDHHAAQTLLMARHGVLPAKEVSAFQKWITQTLPPERAYPALAELVTARAAAGSAPAASTHSLLAKSAKAAGVGKEEQSRALAGVLAASRGTAVPPALFTGAAKVFAATPPPEEHLAAFWELFPPDRWSKNDGGAWLRMLDASGAVDALARGDITPRGGVAGWLQRFSRLHKFIGTQQGVMVQRMPSGLYGILPRLAPRLRAEDRPIDTWSSEVGHVRLDAALLAACLAEDIPVQIPPRGLEFFFLEGPHLRHLFGHPVLGPRVERQVSRYHRDPHRTVRPGARSAIGLFPEVAEVVPLVRSRVERLMAEIGGAGLPRAASSLRALDSLLDPAAIAAFEGVEDDLAAIDPVGPLLRALRCGLPEELGWPAFDAAVAELGGPDAVLRVCSSWPTLTLVGRDRAIAVDHTGRVADLDLPAREGRPPVVRRLDGRFLVADLDGHPKTAYWSDRPDTPVPDWAQDEETASWAKEYSSFSKSEWSGYRFLPTPPQHRWSGQMTDGTTVWFGDDRGEPPGWHAWTGDGVASDPSLPDFFSRDPGEGLRWDYENLSLVRLPDGVDSPLGHADGLSGFRIAAATERPGAYSDDYVIEGADGRRARHHRPRAMGDPYAILRFPGTDVDLVVTQGRDITHREEVCCYSADDDTLQWEVLIAPVELRERTKGGLPFYPPVGFWHFLELRDPGSSRALRGVGPDQARALLDAHLAEGEEGVLRVLAERLPEVTHGATRAGVVRVVTAAAELLRRREALVERVRADRAGLAD
ncbi:hypothetical protein SAMN02745673_00431 [Marinactinospora thermotolerans DSM 45154]|uniref:Uncharacterized protein n=1 Tax=Marinactinospora thermotolerans DSM 45154 TaxID=1122192 RepID=A0A1T4KKS6_9ACTN|nr:hypothetical protein [Marinactinospora thermotolerans]SJZ43010.1 hypothetical protein SAMN02745673_00431 [Marinactinospora thermotolerans DSM 45154]